MCGRRLTCLEPRAGASLRYSAPEVKLCYCKMMTAGEDGWVMSAVITTTNQSFLWVGLTRWSGLVGSALIILFPVGWIGLGWVMV